MSLVQVLSLLKNSIRLTWRKYFTSFQSITHIKVYYPPKLIQCRPSRPIQVLQIYYPVIYTNITFTNITINTLLSNYPNLPSPTFSIFANNFQTHLQRILISNINLEFLFIFRFKVRRNIMRNSSIFKNRLRIVHPIFKIH